MFRQSAYDVYRNIVYGSTTAERDDKNAELVSHLQVEPVRRDEPVGMYYDVGGHAPPTDHEAKRKAAKEEGKELADLYYQVELQKAREAGLIQPFLSPYDPRSKFTDSYSGQVYKNLERQAEQMAADAKAAADLRSDVSDIKKLVGGMRGRGGKVNLSVESDVLGKGAAKKKGPEAGHVIPNSIVREIMEGRKAVKEGRRERGRPDLLREPGLEAGYPGVVDPRGPAYGEARRAPPVGVTGYDEEEGDVGGGRGTPPPPPRGADLFGDEEEDHWAQVEEERLAEAAGVPTRRKRGVRGARRPPGHDGSET